nr:coat protein [Grapevine leafroll-associated virus 13]
MATPTSPQGITVTQNQVVNQAGVLYIVKRAGESRLPFGYTFVRNGTAADASLPGVPDAAYVVSSSTPAPVREEVEDKGVVFEEKMTKISDPKDLFLKPSLNQVLDMTKFGSMLPLPTVEPGLMADEDAHLVSEELMKLQQSIMHDTSNEAIAAFVLACFQVVVTYSTSEETELKEQYGAVIGYGDKPVLTLKALYSTIRTAVSGKNYENPVRQYWRKFSPSIISASSVGKIKPNQKVLAQHGVVKRFASYCLDVLRPSYAYYNVRQIRAWQLAQREAFSAVASSNATTLHNTSELKSG